MQQVWSLTNQGILCVKVLLHKYNFCHDSNYKEIITNYTHISSTYNFLLFSIIFGLHLSIMLL